MPWPTGGPNVGVLVEETRWPIAAGTVDRLIVAHGLETCDRPDALLAGDPAGAGAGGAGHLHRAEPLGALGAARRDAFRLWAALQLRPARGLAAPPPAGDRAPCGGALRAAVAPQILAAGGLFLGAGRAALRPAGGRRRAAWWKRPSRSMPGRPPPVPRSPCQGRSRCWRASPGRSRSRSAVTVAAPRSPPARRARAAAPRFATPRMGRRRKRLRKRNSWGRPRIATLPSLCYHRADFDGDRGRFCARMARRAAGTGRSNGRVSMSGSASLTSGVAGRYATALFEIAKESQVAGQDRERYPRARGRARREFRPAPDVRLADLHPRGPGPGDRGDRGEDGPRPGRRQHARA